MLDGRIS